MSSTSTKGCFSAGFSFRGGFIEGFGAPVKEHFPRAVWHFGHRFDLLLEGFELCQVSLQLHGNFVERISRTLVEAFSLGVLVREDRYQSIFITCLLQIVEQIHPVVKVALLFEHRDKLLGVVRHTLLMKCTQVGVFELGVGGVDPRERVTRLLCLEGPKRHRISERYT